MMGLLFVWGSSCFPTQAKCSFLTAMLMFVCSRMRRRPDGPWSSPKCASGRQILRLRSSTMKCWYAAVEHLPSRKSIDLLSRKKDTLSLELVVTLSICSTERKVFTFTVITLISFRFLRRDER
ncbi:hypothetical protein PF002_g8428 [Phytophthora fragariae]|uniref:Secreted protein n=1 Tax=Phytophthora fragariae TaxID=53985 RepID=A0A6A3ZSI9_9STRA|nr:hypothetical protein PF004_g11379 [Phytophthora fragariae]KAE9243068.1 hypothetical protein PF002_g8428 [Phytophthora fragariae]